MSLTIWVSVFFSCGEELSHYTVVTLKAMHIHPAVSFYEGTLQKCYNNLHTRECQPENTWRMLSICDKVTPGESFCFMNVVCRGCIICNPLLPEIYYVENEM